jgi:hypothetical protein
VTFGLPGYPGVFTAGNAIVVTLPYLTPVTNLVPSFKMSDGATCKKKVDNTPIVSGVTPINFTAPVVYTVTAQDGITTKDYTVKITAPASTACDMLTFNANLAGSSAIISTTSSTAGTVAVKVPFGTTEAQVAALAPSYTLSAFATCNQTNSTIPIPALSTTVPVHYIVKAQDGVTTKDYTVTVTYYGWGYGAWTGDADSGITSASPYTVAVNCNGAAVSVNGVAFQADALSGANFLIEGDVFGWGPDGAPNVTGDSLTLANCFIFGGNPRTVTLYNLTPGATYETSLFAFGFDAAPTTRSQTFASGSDSLVLDQDLYGQNNGIRIAYTFVADSSGSQVLTITPVGDNTFHMSALANRQVSSAPPVLGFVPNGNGTFTLTWTSGTLLEATNVMGPWTTNTAPGPTLIVTPVPTVPQLFYRLQAP